MLTKKQEAITKIKEIFFESDLKWIRCMDLEKLAVERGIPTPTFYRRLREMTQDGILIKDKGKGKKSSYCLNRRAMSKEEQDFEVMKLEIEHFINYQMQDKAQKSDKKAVLELQVAWLGALNLWALLEQIDTGKPFIEIAEAYDKGLLSKQQPYRQEILATTQLLPSLPELIRLSDYRVALGDQKEYKIKIDQWKKALREVFPEQIEAFEKKIAEVRAGKSAFKITTAP